MTAGGLLDFECWTGAYMYPAAFVSTFVIKSFLESHFSFSKGILKQKIQSGLIAQLFTQILSETHENAGKIQNLMSIDTDRASNLCFAWIDIISMMLQLFGSLILLYINMSWTCIVGVSLVIIMIPVNHWIASLIQKSSTQMMAAKDTRASLLSDFLRSIRSVKAYGWEFYFKTKIERVRREELHNLKIIKYSDSVCVFLWAMTSLFMSAGTFGVWFLMGKKLTSERVYPTMSLFNIIIMPINAIPWVINGMVESYVSLVRLDQYMNALKGGKRPTSRNSESSGEVPVIRFKDAKFAHRSIDRSNEFQITAPVLFFIQSNERRLISIQGNAGSGKTSLLLALLNEMECESGEVTNTHNSITYAPQVPFLVPGSIKDNILFGSRFEEERYRKVISDCSLEQDFIDLDGGDQFAIQDLSDLSLSGGQKARIMLARALYPRHSSLILIDDVMSCLDIKLSKEIVRKAIFGDLTRSKTVIIVSNVEDVLMNATDTITVVDGLVEQHKRLMKDIVQSSLHRESQDEDSSEIEGFRELELEDREEGSVSWITYRYYLHHQGLWLAVILISLGLMQATRSSADLWLSYNVQSSPSPMELMKVELLKEYSFMGVYFILVALCGVFTIVRSFSFAFGGLLSAKKIHEDLLESIYRWNFIDFLSHNSGQIMNRLVADIALIDDNLPFIINIYLAQIFGLGGILITILISQKKYAVFLLAVFFALFFWFRSIQRQYTLCSREIKRLESIYRSPLFSYFHSLNEGSISIRAFQKEQYFMKVLDHHLIKYMTTIFASTSASAWLSLRLQLMSSVVASAIVIIGLYIKEYESSSAQYSSLIGLSLSYLLPITSLLGGLVSSTSEVEKEMVSVERVMTYMESSMDKKNNRSFLSTSNVALRGDIVVHHLDFHYPSAPDLALKQVNLTIPELTRCVICGRSGSGKSTLISCLLGLLPTDHATIFYGSMDIRTIARHVLCSNIGYLPQDPVLFSGSIRENLDPYNQFEDEKIIECLTRTGFVKKFWSASHVTLELLDSLIKPSAFSVSERSLLSLSRLLLQNPSYLFLDEPSAAMNDTELASFFSVFDLVFRESTIVESAHKLSRAYSSDLVIILSKGIVIEQGGPSELMHRDSEFSHMMACMLRSPSTLD